MEPHGKMNQWNIWRNEVINDLREVKLRNLMQHVKDKKVWIYLVQKNKTHVGF
jgi:hypothetical protein